jgi:hypothetical protein
VAGTLDELIGTLTAMPEKDREFTIASAKSARAGMLWVPNPGPQTDAYFSPADVLYYGGSAGGGKSQLLLGLAVNEHHVSRLFRRQFKDIDGEGGLAPAMATMLGSYAGYNIQKHVWAVPGTKRKVEFGAFESEKEASDYQGRAADLFGFDEVVQFQEHVVRFICAWNRSTVPGQRCRTVFASNPPVNPEGLWVIEWFAPWLDDRHPNPAEPGELRWFTNIDGKDTEVDAGHVHEIVDASGKKMEIRPKSRTFIPASLSDNPDLYETDYASQLGGLDKRNRDAMLGGIFRAQLDDADLQIIPTEWILAAQQRWEARKGELQTKPMTSVGVDVAEGGNDRLVVTPLHGVVFGEPQIKDGVDVKNPRTGAAAVLAVIRDDPQVNIDCGGGYGSGIAEHLESNGFNVVKCKGAFGSIGMDRDRVREFYNRRAEYVWRFKEALDPVRGDNVALPPGRQVISELAAFRLKKADAKVIQVEDNEDIAKRIGRSPDIAWSFFFAWAEPDTQRRQQRSSTRRRQPGARTLPIVKHQYAKVVGRKSN